MKYKFILIFTSVIFFSNSAISQRRISFQFDASILQSFGRDITSTFKPENNPSLSLNYFSRKKFCRPFANLLFEASYNFNNSISAGIQSGIYLHFREIYFNNNVEHTSVGIPILATLNFELLEIHSKGIGLNLALGKIFESVDDYFFRQKNGSLFRLSAFYELGRKSAFKVGYEKQVYDVTYTYFDGGTDEKKFNYSLNRNSIFLSYEFRIGK